MTNQSNTVAETPGHATNEEEIKQPVTEEKNEETATEKPKRKHLGWAY